MASVAPSLGGSSPDLEQGLSVVPPPLPSRKSRVASRATPATHLTATVGPNYGTIESYEAPPNGMDEIDRVVDDVSQIMNRNIGNVIEKGAQFADLKEKTVNLHEGVAVFKRAARARDKRTCKWTIFA